MPTHVRRVPNWRRGMRASAAFAYALAGALACAAPNDEGNLPPNVQDPATVQTPSGALARYRGALRVFPEALDWFMGMGAILTDELAALPTPVSTAGPYSDIDSRQGSDLEGLKGFDRVYNQLHRVRAQAREARGFLEAYVLDTATTVSKSALRGHLYALEGYAELFLADLFCSGIPLSTVDYEGGYTLAAGSTTTAVYEHATALFDSAGALTTDSLAFRHLAAVGRGRALLALGRYADAAAAVAGVPDGYVYQVVFNPDSAGDRLLWAFSNKIGRQPGTPSLANMEGQSGLDYRDSGDPRISPVLVGADLLGHSFYLPAKHPATGPVTLTVADAVEARLIEAEAALWAASGDWLAKLNALRTDGTFETQPSADYPNKSDTIWHAGTGGVPGLRLLADPGAAASNPDAADSMRIDLLFRERAFWLFMTGHRQGDLRRLVRQYGRPPQAAYPSGVYSAAGRFYGNEVVAAVPASERELNPKYAGCFDRRA